MNADQSPVIGPLTVRKSGVSRTSLSLCQCFLYKHIRLSPQLWVASASTEEPQFGAGNSCS